MALSPRRGRSGYNNTQQGKRNVLQSKASQEKRPALGLGGGGLCQDQNPRESQGPGQKYPSQSWGDLLWEFTTVKSVQTEPLEVYRDLTFMEAVGVHIWELQGCTAQLIPAPQHFYHHLWLCSHHGVF